MAACLFFGNRLLGILKLPYVHTLDALGQDTRLQVLSAPEGFLIYMKVALIAGLLLTSPWVFYQLWAFVSEGLYRRERRMVMTALPFSVVLFVGGALFYLLVVAEPMLGFFFSFNNWLGLETRMTLPNYISLVTTLMFVFGLGFQMPIVVAILGRVGLISATMLANYRRHVIVVIFLFAALTTSPSPVDQILLGVPMWLLFELGVLLVKMQEKQRARRQVEFD
jgi:sec-independent protein translocase protein TatC